MCTEYSNRWLHGKARWPVDKQACFTKFCHHFLGGSATKYDVPFPWDIPISVISDYNPYLYNSCGIIRSFCFGGLLGPPSMPQDQYF